MSLVPSSVLVTGFICEYTGKCRVQFEEKKYSVPRAVASVSGDEEWKDFALLAIFLVKQFCKYVLKEYSQFINPFESVM